MLAHITDEVGTFCTVYSRTCLPIFIEIGSHLTNREQKNKLAQVFLRHGVERFLTYCGMLISCINDKNQSHIETKQIQMLSAESCLTYSEL